MAPFCVPHQFEIPLVFIVLAFTLQGALKHVKNVHPHASLISQVSHVVLYLQVSSPHVFLPGFFPLVSWGWFWAQSSSILGFFESLFTCPYLLHKNLQANQDKVRQTFCLPFDQIVRNSTNKLTWFLFLMLPRWCLRFTQGGCSSHQKVFAHSRKFMAND